MIIQIDDNITNKCTNAINKYKDENGICPTKLILGIEEYRDLWLYSYYNCTRCINKPYGLSKFAGCDISIKYNGNISCE